MPMPKWQEQVESLFMDHRIGRSNVDELEIKVDILIEMTIREELSKFMRVLIEDMKIVKGSMSS